MFTIRPVWLGGMGLVALLAVSAPQAAAAPPEGEQKTVLCADCHDDKVKAIAATTHGRAVTAKGQPADAACITCHVDAATHAESGGEGKPTVPAGAAGAQTCLTCHRETRENVSLKDGVHTAGAVANCFACHSIHSSNARAGHLLRNTPTALCATCHTSEDSSFKTRPFAHRLGRGGAECTSCHDPHGRAGRDSLRLTSEGKLPCLSCHQEKRGPFAFDHVALAGDCLTCHEAHGSSHPHRLVRAEVQQLCLECHSTFPTGTLGSGPPASHNVSLPRWQNCTTCHVAIHGSNRSPKLLK